MLAAVLRLSARRVHQVTYVPLLSCASLLLRHVAERQLPWPWLPAAPVLHVAVAGRTPFVRETAAIARFVDAHRGTGRPSLFPPAHMAHIARFQRCARTLLAFLRTRAVARVRRDPLPLLLRALPRCLHRFAWLAVPVARLALGVAVALGACDHAAHESGIGVETHSGGGGGGQAVAGRSDARRALREVRAALRRHDGAHLRYLVGGRLTYADLVVAQCVRLEVEAEADDSGGAWLCDVFEDARLADEFADVVAWARAVRQTHCEPL